MDAAKWQEIKNVMSAVLELPAEERADFLARERDVEVRIEVENLLVAHDQAAGFIDQPLLIEQGLSEDETKDNFIGKQIENYLILERIGAGGMGSVYLAERVNSDFKQKVALKLIKRGMDSEAILKRFARERKILSTLKHPNIAQLLDGGISGEGLPFFVMEYVEGLPLNEFCCENQLSLEKHLEIFRQICAAVEYAHKNLVIHRDLKPSNVLVSEDGVPKLLDFGIAKLLTDEDAETTTATQGKIFTPEYASPEQILGKTVTTGTDVYSLGVILYELLSGHRPFETRGKSFDEIVKSVCETEPVRPSAWISDFGSRTADSKETASGNTKTARGKPNTNPQSQILNPKLLTGDLDNIILKALRKEPEERYGSVQQFSEDISRFLSGLPVLARPQTIKYRFGKYVKRHRAGVLAAALVLFSLVGGISVATWQAVLARRERALAEQRFNDVRKLANTVLFEYHDGIERLAGSTPIREKMVKDALEYLDKLAVESGNDADLQREIAAAYQKVGDVQGNPYNGNLGNQDGALESYKKSLAIREALLTADSNNFQTRADLAQSYEKIGDILWAKGESAESLTNYRKALSICEELSKENNLRDVFSFVRLFNRIGQTQEQAGDLQGALETHQKGLKASEEVVLSEPTNSLYRRGVATGYGKIGDIYYQLNDYQKASENYQKSFPILQEISANEPTNTNLRRALGLMLARLSLVKMEVGEFPQAVEYNRQAIELFKEISAADPNNIQLKSDLAVILGNLGETFAGMGNLGSAEEKYREAISIFKEISAKNPDYAQNRGFLADFYSDYAKVLLKKGKAAGALENCRQGLKLLEPDQNKSSETLAEIYESIADALVFLSPNAENLNEAKAMYQKSLDIWQNLQNEGKLDAKNSGKPAGISKKLAKAQK